MVGVSDGLRGRVSNRLAYMFMDSEGTAKFHVVRVLFT